MKIKPISIARNQIIETFTQSIYNIKNGGHINAESGYTKFEEILKVL